MARCPIHHIRLTVYNTKLTKMGKSFECIAGFCPKCKHIYLNIPFFHHYDEVEIQGRKYLYSKQFAEECSITTKVITKNKNTNENSKKKGKQKKRKAKNEVVENARLRYLNKIPSSPEVYTPEMTAQMEAKGGAAPSEFPYSWDNNTHVTMKVQLENEFGTTYWITIVDCAAAQNEKDHTYFQYLPFSLAIQRAITRGKPWVYYRGFPCRIIKFAINRNISNPSNKFGNTGLSCSTRHNSEGNSEQINTECLFRWKLRQNGVLEIIGSGPMPDYRFEELGEIPWYTERSKIRSIYVKMGITRIGKRAFYDCKNLAYVYIAKSVTSIGAKAFFNCYELNKIRIIGELEVLEREVFANCTSLAEIHLPASVEVIGHDCFMNWKLSQKIYRIEGYNDQGEEIKRLYSPDDFGTSDANEICFEDFVAITNNRHCTISNHDVEDIQARVHILQRDGEIKLITIPASYCGECKKYFLRKEQFDNLKRMGIVLCRIVHERFMSNGVTKSFYEVLSPESTMKQFGYSVSIKDDLTDTQRKQLLIYLVESHVMSKQEIINHLSWLIQQGKKRVDMNFAVSKWYYDRNFIEQYQIGSARLVGIKSLKIRQYTKHN